MFNNYSFFDEDLDHLTESNLHDLDLDCNTAIHDISALTIIEALPPVSEKIGQALHMSLLSKFASDDRENFDEHKSISGIDFDTFGGITYTGNK